MKKVTLFSGAILTSLMALSAIGCSGDKLKLVQVEPQTLSANHRNLRVNGNGYPCEQYTEHLIWNEDKTDIVGNKYYVIEDVKALVVPVDFPDYPSSLFGNTEDESREMLRKVMFGEEGETDWYSLAGYYKSSSFGQCNVSGVVAPWFHYETNAADLDKKDTSISSEIGRAIQDKYREEPIKIGDKTYNLADFDANKDGFIDSVIMLYTAPITTTGELWWAFCSTAMGTRGKYTEDGSKEAISRYFWASFNFLFEKGNGKYATDEEIKSGAVKPDAHTMTHEYGHVLSLPDYYITDYSKTDYSGLGGVDMMDYNVGDHNAFSKMMYGWINPRRVDGTKGKLKVELKSTTTTGDVVIIPGPKAWNDTLLDQYLMIEFITPEGVAKKDGEQKYLGSYPLYYNKAGIRIIQVDARMGLWGSGQAFSGYTFSTTAPDANHYVDFAADNTASRSCYPDYKLVELLPATGKSMKITKTANNDCLYVEGDTFGMKGGAWADFKLNSNDGSKSKEFGFKIKVEKINGNESATITISR